MFSESENKRHAAAHERNQAKRDARKIGASRDMKKGELVTLAEKAGLTVTRADGSDGEPTRDDYLRAFGL